MTNWLLTLPKPWRPLSLDAEHRSSSRTIDDILEDLKDWSIDELYRGERDPARMPGAAEPSTDVDATSATTASHPVWLADGQWRSTPETAPWPEPPPIPRAAVTDDPFERAAIRLTRRTPRRSPMGPPELPQDYPSHLGPVPQAPDWEQIVTGPSPWSPLTKPPRATDWGRTTPPEEDPQSRYDSWSIPELLAGHRFAQATGVGEAAQAQEARNAAAYSLSQSTRPIGGREQGPLTDFILDAANPIPQSPVDVGLLALGGPFKPWLKALVLGASGVLESTDAEAGARWRSIGGSAARRTARLPMDDEARMARAKAMGFNMTEFLGHGTAFDFRAFDPRKFGSTTGARTARQGIWAEVNPTSRGVAAASARRAAKEEGAGQPRVIPLMYRAKSEKVIDWPSPRTKGDVEAMIKQAWADGHDAIRFRNHRSAGRVGDAVLVRYPSQLRHPSAVFDPLKKQSRDLFSSVDAVPPDDGDATARRARPA